MLFDLHLDAAISLPLLMFIFLSLSSVSHSSNFLDLYTLFGIFSMVSVFKVAKREKFLKEGEAIWLCCFVLAPGWEVLILTGGASKCCLF